jgi:hypothetical protein
MKKQIIILLFISLQLSAQNKDANPHFPKVKISVPCTQEFIDNYKGKWLIPTQTSIYNPGGTYSKEAMKRINVIYEIIKQIYPQPMGSDALLNKSYNISDFAYTIKYVTEDNRKQEEYVKRNQVEGWSCGMGLADWYCSSEHTNEIWNGYPEIGDGNAITVYANYLPVLTGEFFDDDGWTIDGRPIKTKMHVIGQWKGHDVMATTGGYYADLNNDWFILISREGMLPYIPVTRKQYLERVIVYVTKFYDKMITLDDQIPDKAEREEIKNKHLNLKNIALKKYRDELEKTTQDGLLDAAAVVGTDILLLTESPIFLPESQGGTMLTTENPTYFRKDLAAYVPQLFVLTWSWGEKKLKWETDFRKAIEENFPIEKLQEMIDK